MPRINALVDGFNLYHSIQDDIRYHRYKWLNVDKLLRTYYPIGLEKIYYFTSLTLWDPHKVARHKIFIRALESTGIEIVYGKFKDRDRRCPHCKSEYTSKEEKQTDVGIALKMFRLGYEKKCDHIVLLSGDSDQLPTLKEVHECFPGLHLAVVLPIGREAKELKDESDSYVRVKEKILAKCLFDTELHLADNSVLRCPPTWLPRSS